MQSWSKVVHNEDVLEMQRILAELKKYIYQLEAERGYELEQNEGNRML